MKSEKAIIVMEKGLPLNDGTNENGSSKRLRWIWIVLGSMGVLFALSVAGLAVRYYGFHSSSGRNVRFDGIQAGAPHARTPSSVPGNRSTVPGSSTWTPGSKTWVPGSSRDTAHGSSRSTAGSSRDTAQGSSRSNAERSSRSILETGLMGAAEPSAVDETSAVAAEAFTESAPAAEAAQESPLGLGTPEQSEQEDSREIGFEGQTTAAEFDARAEAFLLSESRAGSAPIKKSKKKNSRRSSRK